MKCYQEATGKGAYTPFADHDKWVLAQWLIKNVNQCATEEFLKLSITKNQMQPSYSSNYTFLRLVNKLPTGPEWTCRLIHIHGDLGPLDENNVAMEGIQDGETEELKLWMRDPVACIRELMGNLAFDGSMAYAPEKLPAGATIAPVILASDKTELSWFKGDKTAWPVYLTIGNISKEVCHELSCHASVLLSYLPVSKLASFENNSVAGYRLFHYCKALLLKPLVAVGEQGVEMVEVHAIFRLPSHLGNYPHPLTYIHWFKPLQTYNNNTKMFCISCSTRQQLPNTEVIPVYQIVQPCHLIPVFSCGHVHPCWIQGHALAEAQHFFLN
ncbi:hypothetical protein HD554DRAFT_2204667 [Boletus coccyginus]|nr:hypothetical protein HD554DRAFT_2204667 [Boletus coccyginus]